jgi:HK97 gp10 family phage protein
MAFQRDFSGLERSIKIDSSSLKSVLNALEKLPKELQKSAEKAVIRAGAKPILKAIKENVSGKIVKQQSKTLKKSLGVSIRTSKSGWVGASIGPRSGFKYATKTGRRGKTKDKNADAQEVAFYLETGTPNMPARPFIRPALESAQGEVIGAMEAGLSKHLTRVAARLASKK